MPTEQLIEPATTKQWSEDFVVEWQLAGDVGDGRTSQEPDRLTIHSLGPLLDLAEVN